jgi:Reprolysin (M12B) family zinc metalloprotease/Disintegrin
MLLPHGRLVPSLASILRLAPRPHLDVPALGAVILSPAACGTESAESRAAAPASIGSADAALTAENAPATLALALDLGGQAFRLELERLAAPSPNYQNLEVGRDGRLVAVPSRLQSCAYQGRAEPLGAGGGATSSGWAVVDGCAGGGAPGLSLRGVLRAGGKLWSIEPDADDADASDGALHRALPLRRLDTPGLMPSSALPATLSRQLVSPAPRLEFREGTPEETKYIDLVVVNDAARVAGLGGVLESDTVLIVAAMNALLEDSGLVPRLRVTLRANVAFQADPYVPAFSGSEVDHDSLLAEFLDWADDEDALPDHDEHLLLSGLDFLGATAGYAGLGVACSSSSNGFIVQADEAGAVFPVLSAVHELGHTLGMDHDDGNPCQASGFIMAAVGCADCPIEGAEFSSCSIGQFAEYLDGPAYGEGARCADDVPAAPGVAACGDGVVSGGESCDCGSEDCSDIDPCCDGSTCELEAGAECSDYNDGCCQGCQVVAAAPAFVCREQRSSCDLAEVCSGLSKDCPADTFLPAGDACEDERGNAGACYLGDCRSRGTQCEQIAEQQGFDGVGVPGPSCGNACNQVVCGNGPSDCIIITGGPTVIDGAPCAGGGQCVDQQCVTLVDQCPSDAAKEEPGTCGCGVADTDGDDDGTANCLDGCPNDAAKLAPGDCGCGSSDADGDGDGTLDCDDGCPDDVSRTTAGACGCGVPETDTDHDGTPDCNDGCPQDALNLAPPCGPARDASEISSSSSFRASARGGCVMTAPADTKTRRASPAWLLLLGLPLARRRRRRAR